MKISTACLIVALCFSQTCIAEKSQFVVDTIIATVDDRPITLQDLGKKLSPPRKLTLAQASSDPQAKEALNGIILEQMLVAEAERRNVKVGDDDVEHYISEVKRRNNLTDEVFLKTLQSERKTLADYKEQVRVDILKSKIASNFIKSSAAVTEEEIDTFIQQGMSPASGGTNANRVHLRRIFLANKRYTADKARELSEKIRSEVKDGGDFEAFAKEYSDAPEAAEGGDLGLVAEKDLSPDIFDALLPLKNGEVTFLVTSSQGYFLYQLVEKVAAEDASTSEESTPAEKPQVSDELRHKVRQKLEQDKMQSKMISYIETELPKLHTIDKRI